MTWLPTADNGAAFFDSASAASWLAGQPQANPVVMLASLVEQLESFNSCLVAPRERFKTLEVLRAALFAVSAESQRRYDHRALPLLAAEQLAFDNSRRLWRAATLSYLQCLRACLDRDPAIAEHGATVTHRVLTCLRLEQMSCYLAGAELAADFWSVLHATWATAEALGIARQPVADPLLRETFESTVSGQYVMALLLHLARPHTLSRGQWAAAVRWLSRWREQARVLSAPEINARSCALGLDLTSSSPIHDPLRAAGVARWLLLDGVLRKIRERLQALTGGESPERLKLGSGLSSAECQALLASLGQHLALPRIEEMPHQGVSVVLAVGLDQSYRLLGGASLADDIAAPTSSFASQLAVDQLAVFGHVVREKDLSSETAAEMWSIARHDVSELQLTRAATGGARLQLKSLLAIRLPQPQGVALATVSALCRRRDGHLWISASLLMGKPTPLLAELHEKPVGKVSRHPAILLRDETGEPGDASALVFLPAGAPGRALSICFSDSRGQSVPGLRLAQCLGHGGDYERWQIALPWPAAGSG